MELCAQHLADVSQLPSAVKQHFINGAFTASVSGSPYSSQGLDEAHETVANRQTKSVLKSDDPQYIEESAHYLPIRAPLHENLRSQVVAGSAKAATSSTHAHPGNVQSMSRKLDEVQPFKSEGALRNIFTSQTATPAEERGMLECHKVGENKLVTYFTSRVM